MTFIWRQSKKDLPPHALTPPCPKSYPCGRLCHWWDRRSPLFLPDSCLLPDVAGMEERRPPLASRPGAPSCRRLQAGARVPAAARVLRCPAVSSGCPAVFRSVSPDTPVRKQPSLRSLLRLPSRYPGLPTTDGFASRGLWRAEGGRDIYEGDRGSHTAPWKTLPLPVMFPKK